MRVLALLCAIGLISACASAPTPSPTSIPAADPSSSVVYQEVEEPTPVAVQREAKPLRRVVEKPYTSPFETRARERNRRRSTSNGFLAAGGLLIAGGVTMHLMAESEESAGEKKDSDSLEAAGNVSLGLGGAAVLTGVILMLSE